MARQRRFTADYEYTKIPGDVRIVGRLVIGADDPADALRLARGSLDGKPGVSDLTVISIRETDVRDPQE